MRGYSRGWYEALHSIQRALPECVCRRKLPSLLNLLTPEGLAPAAWPSATPLDGLMAGGMQKSFDVPGLLERVSSALTTSGACTSTTCQQLVQSMLALLGNSTTMRERNSCTTEELVDLSACARQGDACPDSSSAQDTKEWALSNALWLRVCAASCACPKGQVAGYQLTFAAVLNQTVEVFDTAARSTYVAQLGALLAGWGASAPQITLAVSAASVYAVATIRTASTLSSAIISKAIGNLSATEASRYFNVSFERTVPNASIVAISGAPGSLFYKGGNTGNGLSAKAIEGIVAGILVGFLLMATLYWFQQSKRRQATPLMIEKEMQGIGISSELSEPRG